MAKPQIGDTRGWNERDQTGYKWEKTTRKPDGEWVQYWKGKPTQSRGFVDLFSGSKLKSAVIKEPTEEDKRLTTALDNFVKTKDQPSKQPIPPEAGNEFAENLDIDTNDEFGILLKNAINVLNKNPNDFNANVAMNGMDFLYNYENSKIAHGETGAGDTYVNFKPGELDDEGQLVNTVDNDDEDSSLNNTNILDTNPDTKPNPISTGYQRPSPSERHKSRMEDILVRGRPGAKFKLDRERGRGTNVDDLFTKNRET